MHIKTTNSARASNVPMLLDELVVGMNVDVEDDKVVVVLLEPGNWRFKLSAWEAAATILLARDGSSLETASAALRLLSKTPSRKAG